jgi:probable phosphoglycerate mutase
VDTFRLLLIRHGETEWSRARRFAGARDVPLTGHGRRQCEAVAQALAPTRVAAVYASPLERARVSAEIIARPHGLPVRLEPALREMGFGAWEGLTAEEAAARFPAAMTTWRSAPHLAAPPGGESLAEVAARVTAAREALTHAHRGETVTIVAHAIVIRLVVLAALGLGPERLRAVDASPAGITEIEYQEGWATVHRMNTVAHLADVGVPA